MTATGRQVEHNHQGRSSSILITKKEGHWALNMLKIFFFHLFILSYLNTALAWQIQSSLTYLVNGQPWPSDYKQL